MRKALYLPIFLYVACDRPEKEYGWNIDEDGDGYMLTVDCDDTDPLVHPDAVEICDDIDNDCDTLIDDDDGSLDTETATVWFSDVDGDGFGNPDESVLTCEQPADTIDQADDCDDQNREINPVVPEVCNEIDDDCDGLVDDDDDDVESDGFSEFFQDFDGDGFGGVGAKTAWACSVMDGYSEVDTDCDDENTAVSPGASEVCDEVDNDCDSLVDDDDDSIVYTEDEFWFTDADGDGFGDADFGGLGSCIALSGFVQDDSDCDDGDFLIHPDAQEVCDDADTDEDCDGLAEDDDPDNEGTYWYMDADGDGYGIGTTSLVACDQPGADWVSNQEDCDDTRIDVNPDGTEQCNGGLDDDCNGYSDDSDPGLEIDSALVWYADIDSDHYGDPDNITYACLQPTNYVSDSTDCNDRDASVNPSGFEICGGEDEDCDGLEDDDDPSTSYASDEVWYLDADSDGYGASDDAGVESCSTVIGYTLNADDCDDGDADIHPSADEVCDNDNTDEDCDGFADDDDPEGALEGSLWYPDLDEDGHGDMSSGTSSCSAPDPGWVNVGDDCDDTDSTIYPDALEVCDGIDNDCDSAVDDADDDIDPDSMESFYEDADGDGYGNPDVVVEGCEGGTGYTDDSSDCDDGQVSVHPGMAEHDLTVWDDDCDGLAHHGVSYSSDDGSTVVFSGSQDNLVSDFDASFEMWSLMDTNWSMSNSMSGYTDGSLDVDSCISDDGDVWTCLDLPTATSSVAFDECASLWVDGLTSGVTYGFSMMLQNAESSDHSVYVVTQTQMDVFASTGSGSYLLGQTISAGSMESVVTAFEAQGGDEEILICFGEIGTAYLGHVWVSEATVY